MIYKRLLLMSVLIISAASLKAMEHHQVAVGDPLDQKAKEWINKNSGSETLLHAMKAFITTWPNYYFENQTTHPIQIACAQIAKDKNLSRFTLQPHKYKVVKGYSEPFKAGAPVAFSIFGPDYADVDLAKIPKAQRIHIPQTLFHAADYQKGQVYVYHVVKQLGAKIYLYSYSDKGEKDATDISHLFAVKPHPKTEEPTTSHETHSTHSTSSDTSTSTDIVIAPSYLASAHLKHIDPAKVTAANVIDLGKKDDHQRNQIYRLFNTLPFGFTHADVEKNKVENKKIYIKLSMRFHPDKHPGDTISKEVFQVISDFYDTINGDISTNPYYYDVVEK